MNFSRLRKEVSKLLEDTGANEEQKLQHVCTSLRDHVPYYDWVGFYFRNGDKRELKLRVYAGEATDHEIIPFGKGICGQVAESNQNFVVPDVKAQDNYIACSLSVKSEIVVPMFKNGKNIGQIDIDSNTLDPYTQEDELFLEWVNAEVAKIL